MPSFRILCCAATLGVICWGCDAPAQPPEPTIDVDKKIDKLNDEVAKTRAEAKKRRDQASILAGADEDEAPAPKGDEGTENSD